MKSEEMKNALGRAVFGCVYETGVIVRGALVTAAPDGTLGQIVIGDANYFLPASRIATDFAEALDLVTYEIAREDVRRASPDTTDWRGLMANTDVQGPEEPTKEGEDL